MKRRNVVFAIFALFFLAVFVVSSYQIISYYLEKKEENDLNQSMIQEAVVSIKSEPIYREVETATKPETSEEEDVRKVLLYPDISVDLEKLKKEYPKIVGWLYLPDTVINYPVMQDEDNEYFVFHLPNGAENSAGSIFMDCRNASDLSQKNYVLYGHNMKNNTMFGRILDYRRPEYFDAHPYLFYFTEDAVYRLEIFAGVHTKSDSYVYSVPTDGEDYRKYLSKLCSSSVFDSEIQVTSSDQIFVLSTCSGAVGDEKRFVVCAKLVPLEL